MLKFEGNFTEEKCEWKINIKRCSTSDIIKNEILSYLLEWPKSKILTTPKASKDVKQQELSHIVGEKAGRYSHFEEWQFPTKLNTLLSYHPVSILLHIYPNKLKTHSHNILNTNIYNSCIHNCQNLEGTNPSFHRGYITKLWYSHTVNIIQKQKEINYNRQMGKEVVVHIQNGILLSYK